MNNPICGPEKEACVANQTLKDKSCLVPCTGLYADIQQDMAELEQKMTKGTSVAIFHLNISL